jgi:D-tyrosyl-tRNA(Tyr) deacylase
MRAVIQRVTRASVTIEDRMESETRAGLLVFAGIEESDDDTDIEWLAGKIVNLRIFDDAEGVMNLSILHTGGDILAISQFTLHAKTKKGNRPSYIRAAQPAVAKPIYERFVLKLSELLGKDVKTGVFGAMMQVELVNDGPVTIMIDTREKE